MSRESNTPYFIQSSSFRSLLSPVFFLRFKVNKKQFVDPTGSPFPVGAESFPLTRDSERVPTCVSIDS